jgi:hypothetical protein
MSISSQNQKNKQKSYPVKYQNCQLFDANSFEIPSLVENYICSENILSIIKELSLKIKTHNYEK